MLALVKKPRIEISIHGEQSHELLDWIRKKYDVSVLSENDREDREGDYLSIESTEYWKEMEKNRLGNLLAGARLKAGLTQAQLGECLGIRQNMISDYERGRRSCSEAMKKRLCKVLKINMEHLG